MTTPAERKLLKLRDNLLKLTPGKLRDCLISYHPPRDRTMGLRITAAEKAEIERTAASLNLNTAEYLTALHRLTVHVLDRRAVKDQDPEGRSFFDA